MPLLFASGDASAEPMLEIGLLNNLSDKGMESGERQIVDLLRASRGRRRIRLTFYALPQIPRGATARDRVATDYAPFQSLFDRRLDGLFVTGCEPAAEDLRDEPFWPALTDVIDWAEHNTRSTIWSCLAAHAAVLHRDGVQRHGLATKCTGLFAVDRVASHPLLDGADMSPVVPHSRYNDVSERDLVAAGYTILTRHPTIGVDAFIKRHDSLFVFLQGHPEYDAGALGREYRRDVARFDAGETDVKPPRPENYFAGDGDEHVARDQRPAAFATTLVRNWLAHLHAGAAAHAD